MTEPHINSRNFAKDAIIHNFKLLGATPLGIDILELQLAQFEIAVKTAQMIETNQARTIDIDYIGRTLTEPSEFTDEQN